jgi:hypothetical protein
MTRPNPLRRLSAEKREDFVPDGVQHQGEHRPHKHQRAGSVAERYHRAETALYWLVDVRIAGDLEPSHLVFVFIRSLEVLELGKNADGRFEVPARPKKLGRYRADASVLVAVAETVENSKSGVRRFLSDVWLQRLDVSLMSFADQANSVHATGLVPLARARRIGTEEFLRRSAEGPRNVVGDLPVFGGEMCDQVIKDRPQIGQEISNEKREVLGRLGINPKAADIVRSIRLELTDRSARLTPQVSVEFVVDRCQMLFSPFEFQFVAGLSQ